MTTATKKPPAKRASATKDELDLWVERANADPRRAMMMMLWRNRMQNPDMYVKVEPRDLQAFQDSCVYQKLKPAIVIHREAGLPAQPAIPARGNQRAIPARDAVAPKPYAVIALVEEKNGVPTMNMVKPIENNQEDYDRSLEIAEQRKARDQAPDLAARLLNAANTGDFSSSDLRDAANALAVLSRA